MPPQSFGSWQGLLDASSFGNQCTQGGGGSEDCSFLNIYVPNFKKNVAASADADSRIDVQYRTYVRLVLESDLVVSSSSGLGDISFLQAGSDKTRPLR